MKVSVDWPRATVFGVALVCATVLVFFGKVPLESLTVFAAWLLKSPVTVGGDAAQ